MADEDLTKMEKQELRSVIKYFYLEDRKTADKIHNDMKAALGYDKPPSYPTITKWLRHFRTGHMST